MSGTIADWHREREVKDAIEALEEPEADFLINNYGTVWSVRPLSAPAAEWVKENVIEDESDIGFGGYAVVVEHRYIHDIHDAIVDAGFTII